MTPLRHGGAVKGNYRKGSNQEACLTATSILGLWQMQGYKGHITAGKDVPQAYPSMARVHPVLLGFLVLGYLRTPDKTSSKGALSKGALSKGALVPPHLPRSTARGRAAVTAAAWCTQTCARRTRWGAPGTEGACRGRGDKHDQGFSTCATDTAVRKARQPS